MQTHIDISGSVGIALAPEHGESFAELCRSADLAMYDAKEKGRNTFSYFHDDLNRISVDKFYLLKLMRDALKEEQFHLYYQPQYDLRSEEHTSELQSRENLVCRLLLA